MCDVITECMCHCLCQCFGMLSSKTDPLRLGSFALSKQAATLPSQAQSQGWLLLIPNSAESALVTVPSMGCAWLGSVAASKKSAKQQQRTVFQQA